MNKPAKIAASKKNSVSKKTSRKSVSTINKVKNKKQKIMAVLDIGSNATRMLVGEMNDDGIFVRHLFTRVPIALGLYSYSDSGIIPLEARRRLIFAVQGLQKIAAAMQVSKLRAIATAAIRDCPNQQQVIAAVHRRTDVDIKVLSGSDEAALVGTFVARQFLPTDTVLNADAGGGSTDCAIIQRGKIIAQATFALGATRKNGGSHREKKKIAVWLKKHCPPNIIAVASGGGARKLSELCDGISEKKLNTFLQSAMPLSAAQRAIQFNLTPDRARNIIPAAQICQHILTACGAKKMHTINGGLGEAVLVRMLTGVK